MMKSPKAISKLVICIFSGLISSFTLVLTPYYLGLSIDAMIGQNQVMFSDVTAGLTRVLVCYGVSFVFGWFTASLANQLAVEVISDYRYKALEHISNLPISYTDTHAHGGLQNIFNMDAELAIDGLYLFLTQLIGGVFTVIITSYYMLRINGFMSLVVFATIPIVYIISRFIAKHAFQHFSKQQNLAATLSSKTQEYIDNYHLLLSSNYGDLAQKSFDETNSELSAVGEKAQFMSAVTNPTTRILNNLSYAMLGLLGAYSVMNGSLTVGLMTSFLSYSMMFSKPFNEFSAIFSQVIAGKAGFDRMNEILSIPTIEDKMETKKLSGNTVGFEKVDFSYVPNKPIIKNLNLSIKPLSKVAIVGPTGAGKSTIINLLMRYYEVDSGTITIDGLDISELSYKSSRDVMTVVLQDPWLFEGSILENIRYGNSSASLEEVYAAAEQAGCHEMILSFDNGYDTLIEANSQNISLGQRQLITIARAYLVDAPIIILDEATSSVDLVTEKHIQDVFTNIMKTHTSFFVAHRLSTVVDADIILVMKDGSLIEQGTHSELMLNKGFYHTLYTSQM